MAKHIGIVGCSAEGAALCYQTICREGAEMMGEHSHPEISMHTHPLSEYMDYIYRKRWEGVTKIMLSSAGKLKHTIPTDSVRERIDRIIFNELVYGEVKDDSKKYFHTQIKILADKGCDSVVLGCTEIPMIVLPDESPLPVLDSTRILARAALKHALNS
jgi:aspartate/glutamate racemase